MRDGEQAVNNYKASHDGYSDKLTTDLKYLSAQKENLNQKILKPLAVATIKVDSLNAMIANTEALEQFIKDRKKQLVDGSIQYTSGLFFRIYIFDRIVLHN